jgi:hypothetical protein
MGVCRRYAPKPAPVTNETFDWPVTDADLDWCGEFNPGVMTPRPYSLDGLKQLIGSQGVVAEEGKKP